MQHRQRNWFPFETDRANAVENKRHSTCRLEKGPHNGGHQVHGLVS